LIIDGARTVLSLAMFEKNRLRVRVMAKKMNEFSAAVSAKPDDTGGDHMINYSLV
jgi:hypothetical protein